MASAVRDSSKFGKQIDPEKQTMEYGSYLKGDKPDIYHAGKVRDANKFGSNKEIFDEQKLQHGSFLQKNLAAQQEHAAKEAQKKQETIAQLKQDAGYTYLDPEEHVFPYAELKNKFPKGVDPIRKEYYLPDEEFEQLFGMSLPEFEVLAAFKKRQCTWFIFLCVPGCVNCELTFSFCFSYNDIVKMKLGLF